MRLLHAASAAGLVLLAAGAAPAAKLDKAICDDLKIEQGLLQQKGVAADMAKGPEWGKTLGRERLKEIERLITVEEQLSFRCPQPKKPLAPGEDDDGSLAAASAKGAKATKAAALPKVVKPRPKAETFDEGAQPAAPAAKKVAKPAPAPAAPATSSDEAPKKAAAPKPKPKPKVDDAYSPPPSQAANSPFKN